MTGEGQSAATYGRWLKRVSRTLDIVHYQKLDQRIDWKYTQLHCARDGRVTSLTTQGYCTSDNVHYFLY